ncbi:MAG TPA: hypothetical protein VGS41_17695, partial [Chthonomonadales bacterium]|nr:hypothetical protein [Chthonomonadales bacterium]
MGNRKFSVTTAIIIVFILGGIYFVGTTVDSKPEGPPAPPKPISPAVAAEQSAEAKTRMAAMQQQMMARTKAMRAAAAAAKKKGGGKIQQASTKPFDPNTIDVTSSYFYQNASGKKGEEEMAVKVKQAEAQRKLLAKEGKLSLGKAGAPAPQLMPMPTVNPHGQAPPPDKKSPNS